MKREWSQTSDLAVIWGYVDGSRGSRLSVTVNIGLLAPRQVPRLYAAVGVGDSSYQ